MTSSTELKIEGTVLSKGDPDYEEVRCRNFATNSHHRNGKTSSDEASGNMFPACIAVVKTVADIQACMKYATENELKVTVRTGGHNWFGCFLRNDVLMIDMSSFDACEIDAASKTAVIGPAINGDRLNGEAAKHGLCFSTGHCVGVPLGGYLLGGGLGWFFQYYGYAAEYVIEVTVVDSQGNVIVANDTENTDWIWLARGSASLFPGVVVSFKIDLLPLPKILRTKSTVYEIEEYTTVVNELNDFVAKHPSPKSELTIALVTTPPPLMEVLNVPKVLIVIETWHAETEEEFQSMIEPFGKAFSTKPLLPGEFETYSSFKGLSEMLAPAFPPGQHWVVRVLMYETEAFGKIQWDHVGKKFIDKAPLGLSRLTMAWNGEWSVKRPGCYGKHMSKGFFCLLIGVHGPDEDASSAKGYVDSMMQTLDCHVRNYDPLAHPVNEETFHKAFDDAMTITEVRNKCDPIHLFFDPSSAKPSH